MRSQFKAALLYVLPAVAVVVVWYLILFEGDAPGVTPRSTFAFVLTDGPRPLWFRWLFALPFLSLALALAYATAIARTRAGSVLLLLLGALLAIASWLTVSAEIAILATLPLVYGFINTRDNFAGVTAEVGPG
jgi:hypothetical protein